MIEILDVERLRKNGLERFQAAIEQEVSINGGASLDFVKVHLLEAMSPVVEAFAGPGSKPEDHIILHFRKEDLPNGSVTHHASAQPRTETGKVIINFFMELKTPKS